MRISASIRRVGRTPETRHIGTWNDSWNQAVPEAYRAVQGLWRRLEQHAQRTTERVAAKGANTPASWESRMGLGDPTLRADVERVRASLREARASSNLHDKALEEAVGLRQHLLPWTPSEHHTSAASAVTRASIRQRLADMPAKERNAYIGRENLSDETVRALCEVDPEMSGFAPDSLLFANFRQREITKRHAEKLARIEVLEGVADYILRLGSAVESAVRAELSDNFQMRADEASDFIADTLKAA